MAGFEKLFGFVAALCCGLFAGAALYLTLVEHPARMECGTELAATEFPPSYRRATVLQVSLALIGALCGTLAWFWDGSLSWLIAAGLLLSAPSYRRATVLQVSLALIGALCGTLAWFRDGSLSWLIASGLLLSVIPFTLFFILPTNKQLLDPSLDRRSEKAHLLLTRWGRLHAVRTVVSLAALVLFLRVLANH